MPKSWRPNRYGTADHVPTGTQLLDAATRYLASLPQTPHAPRIKVIEQDGKSYLAIPIRFEDAREIRRDDDDDAEDDDGAWGRSEFSDEHPGSPAPSSPFHAAG